MFNDEVSDVSMVKYIAYQVKHGVSLEDVLKNLGYVKEVKNDIQALNSDKRVKND